MAPPRRRYNKFHVRPKEERTYNGKVYRSLLEASYARHLDLLVTAGVVREWFYERRYPMAVKGEVVSKMVVDWTVFYPDGHMELHETKSDPTMDAYYNLKAKLFRLTWLAEHPDVVYRVVKYGDF